MHSIEINELFNTKPMKNTLKSACITALLLFTNAANAQINILVVTGGHSFEKEAFFGIFNSFDDVKYDTAAQPRANELLLAEKILTYDCIVFYDMYQVITEKQKEAFNKLLDQGVGMVFLHHALVSYQDWVEFENIRGGKYHLKESDGIQKSDYEHDVDFDVEIVIHQPPHPVTDGIKDFMIHDEVYGNFTVKENVIPLLSTNHPKSSPTIGWAHQYKKSKIVFLQPGHDQHAYNNKSYRSLIHRAIRWTSGKI